VKTFLLILAVLAFWLPESALAQQATIPLVSTTPNANGGSDYALVYKFYWS